MGFTTQVFDGYAGVKLSRLVGGVRNPNLLTD